jgi:hypothetical protein
MGQRLLVNGKAVEGMVVPLPGAGVNQVEVTVLLG